MSVVTAGGVSVATHGAVEHAQRVALNRLASDGVAAALAAKDPALWGAEASAEAAIRLGWLDLPSSSRALLPQLDELARQCRDAGLDHVVLAGMGGSSLAPEVIAATAGVALTVLDTTDPHQVWRALRDRLDRTVVVVSSKSGTTIETDSHRRAYEQAFRDAGYTEAEVARRLVVVTDPGSPLQRLATTAGYRVVPADPNVGGRYSALSAFGLVPSALAGVEVARLLDEAAALTPHLARDEGNPGLALGAALGGFAVDGPCHDKIVLADAGSGMVGFADWVEQLVAESTGKQGRGLLPVPVERPAAAGFSPGPDVHLLALAGPTSAGLPRRDLVVSPADTVVSGPLGAQFLVWEFATAVAGRLLGVNPFDQPNVQESKENTARLLAVAEPAAGGEPAVVDEAVEVHAAGAAVPGEAKSLADVLEGVLAAVPATGYLAVMAYLDRTGDAAAARLRELLAARSSRPVTFGWGPRFLHSTGQFHKGGPQVGVFLQITGAVTEDLAVPGRPYTFGQLQLAQALGDLNALAARGRPVVRLHLRDREAGLRQLLETAAGDRAGRS